jgi:tetratricopeptide (TPR) repeat protein
VKAGTATLATRLKALGFATGAFVGGFPLTKRFGLTPGFDVYDDQMPEMKGAVAFAMPERRADVVAGRALEWMTGQSQKFFSWVHVFDAHSPYRPPAEFASTYASQPYYGEVAFIDRALGPLLDRLRTLPRPTLVIITSDHGESLGEHGELTHGMFAYESTLHVPLIVAEVDPRASRAPRGVVVDTPVRHIDIAPTVLASVGAQPDTTMAGLSLVDAMKSGAADRPGYFESMTYALVRGWAPLRGALVNRTKYIDLPIPELYDLATDPKETHNLAASSADRLQVMNNTLKTYNVDPPDRPGRETAETQAALRSLGYVSGSAPARQAYTEDDDPKRLAEVDRDLHAATDFYQDGKFDEAVAMFQKVIARRPDTADAYISLAHAYWEAGRVPAAISTLEQALTRGVPDRDVRIRLGLYLAESHTDATRAIKVLEALPENDVEALNGLGIAYSDAKRFTDAKKAFAEVLALDPTNGLAYQNLAFVALSEAHAAKAPADRTARLKDAEAAARQAVTVDPSLAGAFTTLGVILSESGRKNDAIDSWRHAVDLDPTEFDALYNLWSELAASGRREEAIAYGRQFVATAPPAMYASDIERVRRYLGI